MDRQGRDVTYNPIETETQAQMRRNEESMNQGSNDSAQRPSFTQQSKEGVMKMAQGATTMTEGAVQGVTSVAQGAVTGVASIAQGAFSAVKNTLGMNPDNSSSNTTHTNTGGATNRPTNPRI